MRSERGDGGRGPGRGGLPAVRRGLAALREPRFRLFFGGYSVSLTGSAMASTALPFAVLASTGSLTDVSVVMAARIVPLVVLLLIGGVAGDRLPRRRVMLAADTLRTVSQAALAAALLTGRDDLLLLVALAALGGVGEAFFGPSLDGLVTALVPARLLQDANALLSTARSVASLIGPAAAGLLATVVSPALVLGVDAVSYLVSSLMLAALPVDGGVPQKGVPPLVQLREGWVAFRSRTWLWAVTLQFCAFNLLVWGPFLVLGPITAERRYGGPDSWGLVMAAYGLGALAGGLALLGVRPRRPLLVTTAASLCWAAPSACLALHLPLAAVAAGALCAGVAQALFGTLWPTTLQEHIPNEMLSRVRSYVSFGSLALGPVGLSLAGPLAQRVGVGRVLAVGALWQLVAACAVLALPAIRGLARPAAGPAEKVPAAAR
ncbi:MFS transporter [Kitasatospora purpeofusca]|uniref:MFS transporter n=1 Tax=Kitasatospora purpeofusca TaxID=67352 RepID=A0ABZ1U729_9ACTN|nr:MFS transporter [Kitasatospora purpeofusca]